MDLLDVIGFAKQDVLLIVLCPVFAVIGGVVRFVLLAEGHFVSIPEAAPKRGWNHYVNVMGWAFNHCIASAAIGLVFALYFVGTLAVSPTTVAKQLAFAVLIGFAAPKLWQSQEKALVNAVEAKLKELFAKQQLGSE